MPTPEAELLGAIWKAPDDREALSVYADWLIEHGDATRGEYIQLSLLEAPSAAQKKRRTQLVDRHRGAWLGPARKFVWTWVESDETPGFVARAQCSMPKLTAGLDHVRMLGPRLYVSVSEPKAKREVVALSGRPLGTLWGICLFENDAQWITDDLLETLAPSLEGLRAFVLHPGEARSSDRGWRALLPHLSRLEHLELQLGDNPEAWLEALVAPGALPNLQRLSVPGWITATMKARLSQTFQGCAIELRRERRSRFNRATGYYIP
jgi:uncharacterized protein (TIGR02996 family)